MDMHNVAATQRTRGTPDPSGTQVVAGDQTKINDFCPSVRKRFGEWPVRLAEDDGDIDPVRGLLYREIANEPLYATYASAPQNVGD